MMDGVGQILLKNDWDSPVNFHGLPIIALPDDIVIRWLEKHGLNGARVLARHLTRPCIYSEVPSLHPATRYVLDKFGADDIVFSG